MKDRKQRITYDSHNADMARMGYVFPVIVLFLILAPFFFVVPYVIIPFFGWGLSGVLNVLFAGTVVFLILVNYYKSLRTPPGSPPVGWRPDEEAADYEQLIDEKKFCQKCNCYKPPRCHHCRICNKCILKMDHHCPWINNCVGHDNHKFFLLFLIYAVLGIFYALVILLMCFIDAIATTGVDNFVIIFGFTVTATIMFPVGLAILMLLCWQLWLVTSNTTSIEYEEYERYKRTCKKEGKPVQYVNKYNAGFFGNLRTVFGGGSILWWFLPFGPTTDHSDFKKDYRTYVNTV